MKTIKSTLRSLTRNCVTLPLFATTLSILTACSNPEKSGNIEPKLYFAVKTIGPSVNIQAIDHEGKLLKLTDDTKWRDLDMDISSKGDIVFVSNRKDNFKVDLNKHSESFDVFLLNAGTTQPTQISTFEETELTPKFSSNPKWLAFIKKGKEQNQLVLFDREENTTQPIFSAKIINDFSWSPDGKQIAIAYNSDTYSNLSLYTLADGVMQPVLNMPLSAPTPDHKANDNDNIMKQIAYINWSPDQKSIAYIRNPIFRGTRQLRLFNIENKSDQRISPEEVHAQNGVSWSPDNATLLYSGLVDYQFYYDEAAHKKVYRGGMHIFEHTIGGASRQLTNGEHLFKMPTYSPGGDRIAYFYSDALGERIYSLKTMDTQNGTTETLHDKVTPSSLLFWK